MEIFPVAYYHGPLGSKFAIPRQSGVVDALRGRIVLEPSFRHPDTIRGLDGFDRLWLIWGFSGNYSAGKTAGFAQDLSERPPQGVLRSKTEVLPETRLTVRPPRLGGNQRVGVFASRSPFRPNPLGLSCVRIGGIDESAAESPVIHVLGADLMDGTPIYDIKPYIPYADAFPEARSGFAALAPEPVLEVVEGPAWRSPFPPEGTQTLKELIALDPRPAFHDDPARVYGFPYAGWDIRFKVDGKQAILLSAQFL